MNDTSGDEPEGKDEAFVPHDIAEKSGAWDPAHIICDDELHDLFVQLPNDVLLEVYLDTCHSGTGLRGAEFGPHAPKPRYIAPPEHEFGDKTAKMRGFTLRRDTASKDVAGQHQILWTGCKANETSADAYFDGRYNGAFTYYFVKVMRDTKNKLSRKDVIAKMRTLMHSSLRKTRNWKATLRTADKRSFTKSARRHFTRLHGPTSLTQNSVRRALQRLIPDREEVSAVKLHRCRIAQVPTGAVIGNNDGLRPRSAMVGADSRLVSERRSPVSIGHEQAAVS